MKDISNLVNEFTCTLDNNDNFGILSQPDLTGDELADVAAGAARLAEPVRSACLVVLNEWPGLDGAGRLAALLVLANALAEAQD